MSDGQVKLSFSTINSCLQPNNSHCWINKMLGKKIPENESMKLGKEGHRIIQGHLSGKKPVKDIDYIKLRFSIVEETDFDPRCKFSFEVDGYEIRGYYDALDDLMSEHGEIKLSSAPWSIVKFKKSVQRKIYALANKSIKKAHLITGSLHPGEWKTNHLKVYSIPVTDKDREDALKWIREGIAVLEAGDFTGGLDENDRCTDRWCPYGNNCHFKQL